LDLIAGKIGMGKMEKTEKLSRSAMLWMFLFVALTLLLRLLFLGTKPLWLDEAKMVMLAAQSPATIIFGTAGDIHPPAGYFILHFWQQLFGMSEFAVRLPSALFISFSLIPIFLAARRIFGEGPLPWLGIIFALSPYTLYVGQEVRTYAYVGFFCAWVLYFAVLVTQGYGWKGYLGYGLSSLAALHMHHLAGTLVGGLAIYLFVFEFINRRNRWWWLTPLTAIGLTFVIYIPQMLETIAQIRLFAGEVREITVGGSTLFNIIKCTAAALFHMGSGFYFTSLDAETVPVILAHFPATAFLAISAIIPVLVLLAGIVAWFKLEARYRWLIAIAIVVPFLIIGYFLGSARHFIPMLPAYLLLICIGMQWLWRRNWGKIVVAAMILLSAYTDIDYYSRPLMPTPHHYQRNYRQVGEYLRHHAKPGDLIYLLLDHYSVLNTRYYLDDIPVTVDSYYRDYHFEHVVHSQALDYIVKVDLWGVIDKALAQGKNIWLVANDPRAAYGEQLITKSADLNLGIDADKACDTRLYELDKRYPQARVVASPGDILRIIYIPHTGAP
jgi:hypothetical protein